MEPLIFNSEFLPEVQIAVVLSEHPQYEDLKPMFDEYGYGFMVPGKNLIIIDGEQFINNFNADVLKFIEAHEVSHIILGHDGPRNDNEEMDADLGAYLLLKKIGCHSVLGVDFNKDAFNCASSNALRNPDLATVEFIHSDLFVNVSSQQFDLIVFNFNYYPSNGVFGLNPDGGQEILKRFFSQVSTYITDQTRIYIPYSLFVGEEHDPKNICSDFGFIATIVETTSNRSGEHVIYEVMRAQQR